MKNLPGFLLFVLIASCVGVDVAPIELVPPRLSITTFPTSLNVDDEFQLTAEYFDSVGSPTNLPVTWKSSDTSVATVSSTGLLQGKGVGTLTITASVKNVMDEVEIVVSEEATSSVTRRVGTLNGRSGYTITGTFSVYFNPSNTLVLDIVNANISSAPGPYYYLSNSPNSIAGGLKLGKANDGSIIYPLPTGTTLQSYNFLVVWCDPFNIPLGHGEFMDAN